jgi:hypothetical protein
VAHCLGYIWPGRWYPQYRSYVAHEAGYEEGKNLVIEFREASGHYSALPELVDELIA